MSVYRDHCVIIQPLLNTLIQGVGGRVPMRRDRVHCTGHKSTYPHGSFVSDTVYIHTSISFCWQVTSFFGDGKRFMGLMSRGKQQARSSWTAAEALHNA